MYGCDGVKKRPSDNQMIIIDINEKSTYNLEYKEDYANVNSI